MDKKKEFDSFTETKNASDIFSFSEQENEKQFLSETFVYKFEDNKEQTGSDFQAGQTGAEENSANENAEHFEEHKIEKEDIDKFSQQSAAPGETGASASSSSSASTASTSTSTAAVNPTVATVATVTTTAVVIVVGGALVVGQTFEKPAVCEMVDISAVDNNISFKLQIGNTAEEATSQSGGESCDIVVELLCPSEADFRKEFSVANYGEVVGQFTDLAYDTTYSVNVYQNALLDIDKQYLFEEAFSVTTGADQNISFEGEMDPFGNIRYYVTVKYNGDLSKYDNVQVGIYDPNMERDPEYPEAEYMYTVQVDKSLEGRYEFVCGDLPEYDQTYGVDLMGENYETQDFSRTVLLSSEVNFKHIIVPEFQVQNKAYFEKEYNGDSTTYYVYVGADSTIDTSYYDRIDISVYEVIQSSDPSIQFADGVGDAIYQTTIREFNTKTRFDIDFEEYSEYETYLVQVKISQINSPDEGVEHWSGKMTFYNLPMKEIAAVNDVQFVSLTTYQNNYIPALRMSVYDPKYELNNYKLRIYYVDYSQDEPESFDQTWDLTKDPYMLSSSSSEQYYQIVDWDFYNYGVEINIILYADTLTETQVEVYTGITTYPEIPENVTYNGCVSFSDGGENDTYASIYVEEYSFLTYYTNWRLVITNKSDLSIVYNESMPGVNQSYQLANYLEPGWTYQVETYATNPDDGVEFLIFVEDIELSV